MFGAPKPSPESNMLSELLLIDLLVLMLRLSCSSGCLSAAPLSPNCAGAGAPCLRVCSPCCCCGPVVLPWEGETWDEPSSCWAAAVAVHEVSCPVAVASDVASTASMMLEGHSSSRASWQLPNGLKGQESKGWRNSEAARPVRDSNICT